MAKKILFSFILLFLAGAFLSLKGQTKTLPSNPDEFIKEFILRQDRLTDKKKDEDFLKLFQENWASGIYTPQDQGYFLILTNKMLEKNFAMYPEVFYFAKSLQAQRELEVFAQIPSREYFEIADSCVQNLTRNQMMNFLKFMTVFYEEGSVFKTKSSSWKFTETAPDLRFTSVKNPSNGKLIKYPELHFTATDLVYSSPADCTVIQGTTGSLNIVNRWYSGNGGRIDWGKMGLEPGDVYCEFDEFRLNLNYPTVIIDTVTFHYNGLLGKSLKGKFEDRNRGYRDINKAAYPYFKSYEGGITIENLVKNTRYSGGFSLKGIRKIGSSYVEWQDIPEDEIPPVVEEEGDEPEEDPYADFGQYYEMSDEDIYSLDEGDGFIQDEDWTEEEEKKEGEEEAEEEEFFEPEYDPLLDKMLVEIPARMEILRAGKVIMKIEGKEFVMDLEKLHAKRTEVTLYLDGGDSIYHPKLELLYEVEKDIIYLLKDVKDKSYRMPYISPYHGYYLYFNAIKWDRTSNNIQLTAMIDKANQAGAIESIDFFKKERFKQFKGVLPLNPITAIYIYEGKNPGVPIFPDDVIRFHKLDEELLDAFIYSLSDLEGSGFIKYNKLTQEIYPTEKLRRISKAVRGKKDYDAIQLISRVEAGSNATLNFVTNEINMHGVDFFQLSDSQYVKVVPFEKEVKVLNDRNLKFGGIVAGGKLNFYGQKENMFFFDYDNYKINCDSLDSLRFILVRNPPMNFVFSPLQKALRNTSIEGVTGAIYINRPNNKGGKEILHQYTIFDSYSNSYIYWAKNSIHEGVYTKDKLYFSIDPFVLDSLERFDEKSITFEGEFETSEIFPRFRQTLKVMDDFTLGLVEMTPDSGYPAYEGKGRFFSEIILDGSGLKGKGQMDFMATEAQSDSFQFFFDSVKAVTKQFFMPAGERNGVLYPEIKAGKIRYKWLTKLDEIEIETLSGEPMVMFGGEATFDGQIKITKQGVIGSGVLTLGEVTVESDAFIFNEEDFQAKKGVLKVADKVAPDKYHFISEHLDIDYDVSGHTADFVSTVMGSANSFFPMNNFRSSLGAGHFEREKGEISLEAHSTYNTDNYFISTDPAQDSLEFMAQTAFYSTTRKEVDITGIPFILTADAKVTPDSGWAMIKSDGLLKKLKNAEIEANQTTKYHNVYEADVEILSKIDYTGLGKYDYIEVNDKPQYINMTEIFVKEDSTTMAFGTIEESQKFYLTEKIFFKGKTTLNADDKYLLFDGAVKIESRNEFLGKNWINFKAVVNPDSIFIQLKELKDPKGVPLHAGLFFVPQPRVFYSVFLQRQKAKADKAVLTTSGGLTVDRTTGEFKIGPKDKLTGVTYRGTVVSFDDDLNTVSTEGLLSNFPYKFNKGTARVKMAGMWKNDMKKREVSTDLLLALYLDCIPKEALTKLSSKWKIVTVVNDNIDFENPRLISSLAEMLDEGKPDEKLTEKFVKSLSEVLIYTDVKVAKDIPSTLLLSGVNFSYSSKYKALYANAEIGLIGIGGEEVNKRMNAKVEYNFGKMSRNNVRATDTITVYIEIDDMNWVYFRHSGDVTKTWSSDPGGYNAALAKVLAKQKKAEGFRVEAATDSDIEDYLGRFINRYIWLE